MLKEFSSLFLKVFWEVVCRTLVFLCPDGMGGAVGQPSS